MAVELSSLPVLVRRYVERVLPAASPIGKRVQIGQIGEMTLKPGARPRRLTATEEFATDRVAFAWRARFPIVGPISLRVTDSYGAGEGILDVRLPGLPLQRAHGPELALGEAFRYLAEMRGLRRRSLRTVTSSGASWTSAPSKSSPMSLMRRPPSGSSSTRQARSRRRLPSDRDSRRTAP